ncbi:MAG: hypothetical protein Q3972_06055 [Corynebacterium sp.]|nr:hypothetical protein [Corynebacterium sp.]
MAGSQSRIALIACSLSVALPLSTTTPLFSQAVPLAQAESSTVELSSGEGTVTASSTDSRNYTISGAGTIDNQKFR